MMDSLAKEATKPVVVDSTLLQCYVVDWQTGIVFRMRMPSIVV